VATFDRSQLDRAFDARTVAVIGASRANGYFWLKMFNGFHGTLASVHVNPESIGEIEAMGIPNYRRIGDVPGPVDYVVVNIARKFAIDTFAECIDAGVGAVSFFTAGFAETDDDGRAMQATLSRMSHESGVPLLGPNCTGIYNPSRHMSSMHDMPTGVCGDVAMVSQSGTHAGWFAKALHTSHGLHEARGVSFGNAAALDAADWFEYLGLDPRVRVLASYLEGVGDRARFVAAARAVTARKPVVIWKGGATPDGARAAANHTGAEPVAPEEWAWILDQTGAIGVDSMEALVDTTAALCQLRGTPGPRFGVLILTGGQGIAITDTFGRHGLRVPPLTQASLDELCTFFDPIGGSYRNPLDAAYATETPAMLERELAILERDQNIDAIAVDLFGTIMSMRRIRSDFGVGLGHRTDLGEAAGATFLDVLVEQAAAGSKPSFVIVTGAEKERDALDLRDLLRDAGVLTFPSAERAATAYAHVLHWHAGFRRRQVGGTTGARDGEADAGAPRTHQGFGG
jgi:acyl-CoA synthetase (NDP forming)